MKSLTELGMSEDGCVYGLNGGYVVVVFACRGGPDTLYYTDDREEAFDKIGMGEPDAEEKIHIELVNGMKLMDLMVEYEELSKPQLDKLMEEQGYYLDKEHFIIRKKAKEE